MKIQKIYIGGWFQRTHLHLREIYNFLTEGNSPLDLDQKKLKRLQSNLKLKTVEMKIGSLDCIKIKNDNNIDIKIFEDGLIILSKNHGTELKNDIKELTSYYEQKLSAGLNYIFSLGAPVPKELAGIKTIYPYFIVLENSNEKDIKKLLQSFQQKKYFEIKGGNFEIYRGNKLYIVNNIKEKLFNIEKFIQEQIFIREFRGQMHRYLNLHRIIWEKIAKIKEKGEIKGKDVGGFKDEIESYAKTINLIETRINQMGAYICTRESIVEKDKELIKFAQTLEFKYRTLLDTLKYVKEIWSMTKSYVESALSLFSDIQAESTQHSLESLAIITSMGVGATLIGLFTEQTPTFTRFGVFYFLILVIIGYTTNTILKKVFQNKIYKIKEAKITKDIKFD